MKKKRLAAVFVACAICVVSALSANAITCDSGYSGQCFTYGDSGTIVPYDVCVWTGREKDHCRTIGRVVRTALTYLGLFF